MSKTWEDFVNGLGCRVRSFLRRSNLCSFDSLARLTSDDLIRMSGCGKSTLNEIEFRLNLFGYSLKPGNPEIANRPPDQPANRIPVSNNQQGAVRESLKALAFKLPLRDLCAFEAMSAVIRNDPGDVLSFGEVARVAYAYADAMMAFRDRKGDGV